MSGLPPVPPEDRLSRRDLMIVGAVLIGGVSGFVLLRRLVAWGLVALHGVLGIDVPPSDLSSIALTMFVAMLVIGPLLDRQGMWRRAVAILVLPGMAVAAVLADLITPTAASFEGPARFVVAYSPVVVMVVWMGLGGALGTMSFFFARQSAWVREKAAAPAADRGLEPLAWRTVPAGAAQRAVAEGLGGRSGDRREPTVFRGRSGGRDDRAEPAARCSWLGAGVPCRRHGGRPVAGRRLGRRQRHGTDWGGKSGQPAGVPPAAGPARYRRRNLIGPVAEPAGERDR